MKVLAANPEATAYHFLLREFKLFRNFTFSENDLNCFINFFYDFAEGMGYKFVDKNGNDFSRETMLETIMFSYVYNTTNNMGKRVCYFGIDGLDKMRSGYEKCNFFYKQLILRYEEYLTRDAFSNRKLYSMFEDGYKKLVKNIEKDEDKNLA